MMANDLSVFRQQIDAIDDQIVPLLAKRFAIASLVADYKQANGISVRLDDRIGEVLDRVGKKAKENGAEAEAIRAIYQTIIETTCRFEEAKIGK